VICSGHSIEIRWSRLEEGRAGRVRGTRPRDLRRRLHSIARGGGGWSSAGDGELRSRDDSLDSLRVKIKEKLQGMRQRMGRRLGGEGGAVAHQQHRNRPVMSADKRGFGEEFLGG
jgi:hypothetical protein